MNTQIAARFCCQLVVIVGIWLGMAQAQADTILKRTWSLQTGWNAVFLDVDPASPKPDDFFSDYVSKLEQVVAFYPAASQMQYLVSPDEEEWNINRWRRWVPAARPEAVLNNLYAMQRGKAYLIKVNAAFTLSFEGAGGPNTPEWVAESFNLTGFAVQAGQVSFARYFAGSDAHNPLLIYQLNNNYWQQIPASTLIKPGEAYWVYCRSASAHSGPLHVKAPGVFRGLAYGSGSVSQVLTLTNYSGSSLTPTLALEQASGFTLLIDQGSVLEPDMVAIDDLVLSLENGDVAGLVIEVNRSGLAAGQSADGLVKVSAAGVDYYVPVSVSKSKY